MPAFQAVCDAWMADLTTNVAGLRVADGVQMAQRHLYNPKAMEDLVNDGSRHIAIRPAIAQPAPVPLTVGGLPGDQLETAYVVLVWEDASDEAELRYDNDTANAAWLALATAIEARFRVQSHTNLGEVGGYTRIRELLPLEIKGTVRVMSLAFSVRSTVDFTA